MSDLTDIYGCHICGFMKCTCLDAPATNQPDIINIAKEIIRTDGDDTRAESVAIAEALLIAVEALEKEHRAMQDALRFYAGQKGLLIQGQSTSAMYADGYVAEDGAVARLALNSLASPHKEA